MNMVAAPGLEPGLPKAGMQILSLLCLPFHHAAWRRRCSTACARVSRLPAGVVLTVPSP
jgi:hypothetical protein